MSRKHFAAIAATIAALDLLEPAARAYVAERFADTCAEFNPNFDRAWFLKACGVYGGASC